MQTCFKCHYFSFCSAVTVLYDGRLDERKALREEYSGEGKFNVIITHYDLIMRDKAFLKKIHWNYLIIDEGHRLKNHECALARTVAGYVNKKFELHIYHIQYTVIPSASLFCVVNLNF